MPTYYVDGSTGNDGNAGTSWGAAKLTLNGAEDIPVAAGDTVWARNGPFNEQLTCDVDGIARAPIMYRTTDASVIDGAGLGGGTNCIRIAKASRVFKGFKIANGVSYGVDGASGYYFTLLDCEIYNCNAGVFVNREAMIHNCIIRNSTLSGIVVDGDTAMITNTKIYNNSYGIYIVDSRDKQFFSHNEIYNNTIDGMHFKSESAHTLPIIFENNVVDGNGESGVRILYDASFVTFFVMINNIFSNNTEYGVEADNVLEKPTVELNNCFYLNGTAPAKNFTIDATTDVITDPLFVDLANADFGIYSDSPCYQTGINGVGSIGLNGDVVLVPYISAMNVEGDAVRYDVDDVAVATAKITTNYSVTGMTVLMEVKKESDNTLIETIKSEANDFVKDTEKTITANYTCDDGELEYYFKLTVSDGTPTIVGMATVSSSFVVRNLGATLEYPVAVSVASNNIAVSVASNNIAVSVEQSS